MIQSDPASHCKLMMLTAIFRIGRYPFPFDISQSWTDDVIHLKATEGICQPVLGFAYKWRFPK